LLVVIAIITILLAIMAPSLRRARALVSRAHCASNLHHAVAGLVAYAAGNNGQLPPPPPGPERSLASPAIGWTAIARSRPVKVSSPR